MSFGDNTNPHPLLIEDAREAQHKASESQRKNADLLGKAHKAVADAEYTYRVALTARIKQLKAEGWAVTTCDNLARGEASIAALRKIRDEREGDLREGEQSAYTLAADRRALDGLIDWSKRRELRIDTEPGDWSRQPTDGAGVPPGVDPRTGELRAA
jgi:hypothetical protein